MPSADATLIRPQPVVPIPFDVRSSMVMELIWALFLADDDEQFPVRSGRFAGHEQLEDRIAGFWEDGERSFTEVFVCAERGGVLFEDDPDRLWAGLEAGASAPPRVAALASETAEDRARFWARLGRLHDDPDRRAAWLHLLRDTWAVVAGAWADEGRDAAAHLVWQVRGRVPAAGSYADLAPLADGCDFAGLLPRLIGESAAAGQQVVLVPAWLGRKGFLVSLSGWLLWGPPNAARPAGPSAETRARARRHKALGDPTRLAIFEAVACRPRTVGELAKALGVAQPTVSNHVRILRDAGLLLPEKEGSRRLTPDVAAFERFLDATRRVVVQP